MSAVNRVMEIGLRVTVDSFVKSRGLDAEAPSGNSQTGDSVEPVCDDLW